MLITWLKIMIQVNVCQAAKGLYIFRIYNNFVFLSQSLILTGERDKLYLEFYLC